MVSTVRDEPLVIDWLPNGRTSLVVRVTEEGRGDAYVIGPRTRAKFKRATGFVRATAIQFKPGWSPWLFGVPANALTDQLITLDELWGSASGDVTAELVAAHSVPAMLERLSRAVAVRSTAESASARLARRAARMFEATETGLSRPRRAHADCVPRATALTCPGTALMSVDRQLARQAAPPRRPRIPSSPGGDLIPAESANGRELAAAHAHPLR